MSTSLLTEFWRTRRTRLLTILGLGWLGSVCTFMVPVSLGAFFDIHFQSITNRTKLLKLFGVQLESMEAFFTFFAGVIVLKAIFTYAEKYWITREAEQFIHQVTQRLFATQINWSPETFQHKPYGRYLLRYSGDMSSVKNLLIKGLHGGIKDLLFLLSGFGILFLLNATLSTILLISLVLYIPLMIGLDRYQNPLIKEKRNRKSFMLSYVASQFAQHKEIKTLSEEKKVIRKFRKKTHKLLMADQAYHVSENVRQILAPLMGHMLTGILLWQVVVRPELQISGGALLVYLLVLASVISPLRRLFKVPGVLRRGMLSLSKIELFLQKEDHTASQEVATKTTTRELVA